MPPKKKWRLYVPPPGVGRRYLNEQFSSLPLHPSDLKNGHVLLIYTVEKSRTATERKLRSHFDASTGGCGWDNPINNQIRSLVALTDKFKKLNNEDEFKKFSTICSKHFTVKHVLREDAVDPDHVIRVSTIPSITSSLSSQDPAAIMGVLLIEPFYTGSHKQLMDTLHKSVPGSQLITLPGKKWPWKARTSALYLSQTIPKCSSYRTLFTSSVLNLAELVALRDDLRPLRKVVYFHENQLTYPVRQQQDRDFQYGYNQILSCLVADLVLFNSNFNMESFLGTIKTFLKKIPDHRPKDLEDAIRMKCKVLYFPIVFPTLSDKADNDLKCVSDEIVKPVTVQTCMNDAEEANADTVKQEMVEQTHELDCRNIAGHNESSSEACFSGKEQNAGLYRYPEDGESLKSSLSSESACLSDSKECKPYSCNTDGLGVQKETGVEAKAPSEICSYENSKQCEIEETYIDVESFDSFPTSADHDKADIDSKECKPYSCDTNGLGVQIETRVEAKAPSEICSYENSKQCEIEETDIDVESFDSFPTSADHNKADIDSKECKPYSCDTNGLGVQIETGVEAKAPSEICSYENSKQCEIEETDIDVESFDSFPTSADHDKADIGVHVEDNSFLVDKTGRMTGDAVKEEMDTTHSISTTLYSSATGKQGVGVTTSDQANLIEYSDGRCEERIQNADGDSTACKPLHIVWPHRWEYDKGPDSFFKVLFQLQEKGYDFRISVLGETFRDTPDIFEEARGRLLDKVDNWGYVPSKGEYYNVLQSADCVVSTAQHEFFGVAMLEAVHCGCYPLCPNRLVYPEIYPRECLYNTDQQLFKRLKDLCRKPHLVRQKTLQFDSEYFSWKTLGNHYMQCLQPT